MSVTVTFDLYGTARKVDDEFKKIRPMLSSQILKDCNKYCKEDTGILKASALTHSLPKEGKVIWQTPYARRQYWEIQTAHKDKNPRATWKWCEAAKQACKEQWRKQAQRALEMNL